MVDRQDLQKKIILSYFNFLSLYAKLSTIKAFPEVSLVLLTLRARTVCQDYSKNAGNFAVLVCSTAASNNIQMEETEITLLKIYYRI